MFCMLFYCESYTYMLSSCSAAAIVTLLNVYGVAMVTVVVVMCGAIFSIFGVASAVVTSVTVHELILMLTSISN